MGKIAEKALAQAKLYCSRCERSQVFGIDLGTFTLMDASRKMMAEGWSTEPDGSVLCPVCTNGHKLLSTKQVAVMAGVSIRTVEGWRQHGGGPAFRKSGSGIVRYRLADVQHWLDTREDQ